MAGKTQIRIWAKLSPLRDNNLEEKEVLPGFEVFFLRISTTSDFFHLFPLCIYDVFVHCSLLIQNKQNDVAEEGGAENGSPQNQFHQEPTANLIQNPSGGEVAAGGVDDVATLSEEGIHMLD